MDGAEHSNETISDPELYSVTCKAPHELLTASCCFKFLPLSLIISYNLKKPGSQASHIVYTNHCTVILSMQIVVEGIMEDGA